MNSDVSVLGVLGVMLGDTGCNLWLSGWYSYLPVFLDRISVYENCVSLMGDDRNQRWRKIKVEVKYSGNSKIEKCIIMEVFVALQLAYQY